MGPRLRIGCSSWTSESWWDRVYPRRLREGERLAWYARLYDCVEVDASYYAAPSASLVDGWQRKTPEAFRFALKFPRDLLDPRRPEEPGAATRFLEAARRLGPKLGPILLQFPPWFAPGASGSESRTMAFLLRRIATLPDDLEFSVELRHRGWFEGGSKRRILDALSGGGHALCWSSLTYLDVPAEITTDWTYLRFIGDHETVPADQHGSLRVDRAAETRRWADRLMTSGLPVAWGLFNTHYAGFAPESLNEFRRDVGLPPVDYRSLIGRERLPVE